MSDPVEPELARLRERFVHHAHELADLGFFLRGSIAERFTRCGSAGCACHVDPSRLHGPYWQWTRKVRGKTVTRNLSERQRIRCQQWIDNAKRFDEIVKELQDLSTQAEEFLRTEERQAGKPSKG